MIERAWSFGRLPSPDPVPLDGERTEVVASTSRFRVEHIVSSGVPDAIVYDQTEDEWVVVLSGAAVLDVGGEPVSMTEGDWVLLPAHKVHRVVSTEPGTRWLAVHVNPL